ncbi:hypothetical protein [Methylomagnum sp.]
MTAISRRDAAGSGWRDYTGGAGGVARRWLGRHIPRLAMLLPAHSAWAARPAYAGRVPRRVAIPSA